MDPELEIALAQRTCSRAAGALVGMVAVLGLLAVALFVLAPQQDSANLAVGVIVGAGQVIGILALGYAVLATRRLGAQGTSLPAAVSHLDRLAQALRNLALAAPALVILTAIAAVAVQSHSTTDAAPILIAAITAVLICAEEIAILLTVRTRVLRRRDRIVPLAKVA